MYTSERSTRFVASVRSVVLSHHAVINKMAEQICVAYMRRHSPAHLQRWNGDQQERWPCRAGLADHLRLQYVSVSGFEMGRRNFVRAHAPFTGIAGRISHDHPRRVALAAR